VKRKELRKVARDEWRVAGSGVRENGGASPFLREFENKEVAKRAPAGE
jgi:hypothetical protein